MKHMRGFTLAELAIVLAIIALLLAGAMIPLAAQFDLRNTADTQRTLDNVKEAIIGFAQANGRLPCPADGTIPSGGNGAGMEQYVSGQCTSTAGVVPWATLGVSETDAWGRRFGYHVVQTFADDNSKLTWNTAGQNPSCTPTPTPAQPASFALCTLGSLTVNNRNDGTHAATAIGSKLPAVIVSHGKNGYGAYTPAGVSLSPPAAGTDEAANAAYSGSAAIFYNRTPTPSASGCSDSASGSPFCEFDDIVVMISSNLLMTRMVAAGRLP